MLQPQEADALRANADCGPRRADLSSVALAEEEAREERAGASG